MASQQRIYLVTNQTTGQLHLVRAINPAVARSHVSRQVIDVRVATADDAYRAAVSGTKVEETGQGPVQLDIIESFGGNEED